MQITLKNQKIIAAMLQNNLLRLRINIKLVSPLMNKNQVHHAVHRWNFKRLKEVDINL